MQYQQLSILNIKLSITVLTAKKINFRHMGRTTFPSAAAIASRYWINYEDNIEIPSLDLMKHMEMSGASHIILLVFKNIDIIMERFNKEYV